MVAPEILHQEIQEHGPKYTAKACKAIWEPRSEEPGNFVEVRSRGGIMTYVNKGRSFAFKFFLSSNHTHFMALLPL